MPSGVGRGVKMPFPLEVGLVVVLLVDGVGVVVAHLSARRMPLHSTTGRCCAPQLDKYGKCGAMTAGNRNLVERVLVELVLQGKRMALSPSKMPDENGMHLE